MRRARVPGDHQPAVRPPMSQGSPPPRWLFALTILTSAFLLFAVQPMLARLILPWYGGSAGVWTTCMLFYQVLLLAGYGYAHWLSRYSWKIQAAVHFTLAAVSLLSLPVFPSPAWKPTAGGNPIPDIMGVLAATVGLPYLLLASTSPLLQSWYVRSRGGAMPWRFFALSNLGSMAGLLTFPFLIEPNWTGETQVRAWSWGYAAVALACAGLAAWQKPASGWNHDDAEAAARPTARHRLLWVALSACGSALLLATTSHMTQNVAAVPLLWVLPLALYLLSFILCFESPFWYQRRIWAGAALLALPVLALLSGHKLETIPNLPLLLGAAGVALFVLLMLLHGELASSRPARKYLTEFYLLTALGGALGGVAIGVGAPLLLSANYDLPLTMAAVSTLLLGLLWRRARQSARRATPFARDAGLVAVAGGLLALYAAIRQATAMAGGPKWFEYPRDSSVLLFLGLASAAALWLWSRCLEGTRRVAILPGLIVLPTLVYLGWNIWHEGSNALMLTRNFYGSLAVTEGSYQTAGKLRFLRNGTIWHGAQFLDAARRRNPTTYYGTASGVGLALRALLAAGPVNVGVVGLGAGTMAAYARPGDRYCFYEINPAVIRLATSEFSFLPEAGGSMEIVTGDARLSLEREAPREFDLLVLDAFSGDSVPVHLLTEQAFNLYWRHLKTDGVLAVHVSNRYLHLAPVVALTGISFGKEPLLLFNADDPANAVFGSEWVLLTSRPEIVRQAREVSDPIAPIPGLHPWTDSYSNLVGIMGKR